MDELWTRIFLIAVALLMAAMVVAVRRKMALSAPRRLGATGLQAGVYLFTSADCAECALARAKLDTRTGEGGYREIAWETEPEFFTRLGVDAVPATMIVEADGSARLWPGQPDSVPLAP
jgi:hypothetical protein